MPPLDHPTPVPGDLETTIPVGWLRAGFGETLFQIFILNATRRLQADRVYTDCYNEETYTAKASSGPTRPSPVAVRGSPDFSYANDQGHRNERQSSVGVTL
ncbi:MAG TPA: hypothetical protein EYM63_09585 [Acidobacteria bacterium]|nr:hypothetical protein [Acidobacteriota bacterium]